MRRSRLRLGATWLPVLVLLLAACGRPAPAPTRRWDASTGIAIGAICAVRRRHDVTDAGGAQIRQRRRELGITQEDLSAVAGVCVRTIRQFERERVPKLRSTVNAIVGAFRLLEERKAQRGAA